MANLYEVRTKSYKTYYVMASGYDEAKLKVEREILNMDTKSIIDANGDLINTIEFDNVVEIKCLAEKLIR